MSDIAIKVQGLGKRFRIGQRGPYRTFRESIMQTLSAPYRRLTAPPAPKEDAGTFWALKDVNFEVKRGEVVGIIGRNGAGKSTLLKVLSRITKPTEGSIELHGRVGSLLEVGTGFHPELTGRENIYLNGAILGMRRGEIAKKFDEIVAFAETEKFLDTPVKHYSSGMYTRLAFAVAAHLEPEILIVDEVLAVGDAEFQKKCLGKMKDVAGEGRTVLFVSHSMASLQRLCDRGILLQSGRVATIDQIDRVITAYWSSTSGKGTSGAERVWSSGTEPGSNAVRLKAVRIFNSEGHISDTFGIDKSIRIEVEYIASEQAEDLLPTIHIINEQGTTLFATAGNKLPSTNSTRTVRSAVEIPPNLLAEGSFTVLAAIVTYNPNVVHALEPDAVRFQVVDHTDGNGARGHYTGSDWPGVVRPLLR
ncbi:MAG TPA: ABC transporter ATP-binding protein, partial [Tepidisphaeraceae bacterium]